MANPVITIHQISQYDTNEDAGAPIYKYGESLLSAFVVPAEGESVGIEVEKSSRYIVGQFVYIQNAGWFEITALTDTTHIMVRNNGSDGNEDEGTVVPTGTMIMPSPFKANPVAIDIQAGEEEITTSNADDTLGIAVEFPEAFLAVPTAVILSIQSDVDIGALTGPIIVYARNITSIGFDIYYTADAALTFNVQWIAKA